MTSFLHGFFGTISTTCEDDLLNVILTHGIIATLTINMWLKSFQGRGLIWDKILMFSMDRC